MHKESRRVRAIRAENRRQEAEAERARAERERRVLDRLPDLAAMIAEAESDDAAA